MSRKSLNTSAVISARKSAATKPQQATADSPNHSLDHTLVAERAKAIWQAKGCPVGQDEQNWLEAESQLRNELAGV